MTGSEASRIAVGVDVGGSGIKMAVVDVERGILVGPRLRVADTIRSGCMDSRKGFAKRRRCRSSIYCTITNSRR